MVQTLEVTGIAAARTTAISLGAWLGRRERLGIVTGVRLLKNNFIISMHALAAHSHAASMHALAAHSHVFTSVLAVHSHGSIGAINSAVGFAESQGLMLNAGALEISDAAGGAPSTSTDSGGTPTGDADLITAGPPIGAIDGVSGGTIAGGGTEGKSLLTYTVDSNGRYVLAATHPATGHFVNRLPGVAGPRVELGDAIEATDILEITTLLQNESGGVF